jgi:gluconate 5-dehydrogenase
LGADPLFSLAGKTALITGAAKGIGFAIATALGAAGASLIITGRAPEALAAANAGLGQAGITCSALPLDVADPVSITACFDQVAKNPGTLDILVNNAGTEEIRAAALADDELWERIIGTNLKGAFFCAQRAAALMPAGGAILNICSLASEVGIPGAAPYGASKSGLAGLTRALAAEWAPQNIRVNGIGPGYFRTDMTEVFYADPAWQEAMLGKIPMRRFGALEDLAGAAIFLCGPAAAYITGQILYVDGGYLASI